jgi:hypothetical protein
LPFPRLQILLPTTPTTGVEGSGHICGEGSSLHGLGGQTGTPSPPLPPAPRQGRQARACLPRQKNSKPHFLPATPTAASPAFLRTLLPLNRPKGGPGRRPGGPGPGRARAAAGPAPTAGETGASCRGPALPRPEECPRQPPPPRSGGCKWRHPAPRSTQPVPRGRRAALGPTGPGPGGADRWPQRTGPAGPLRLRPRGSSDLPAAAQAKSLAVRVGRRPRPAPQACGRWGSVTSQYPRQRRRGRIKHGLDSAL